LFGRAGLIVAKDGVHKNADTFASSAQAHGSLPLDELVLSRDDEHLVVGCLGCLHDRGDRENGAHEAEGAFKYANPAACEALGYTLDELLALSIHDIDPKYSSHWAQHISGLKQAGSLTFETQHRRRDGTLVPVEVTAAYLEYDGVAYDVGFARDITERKQVEAELERERRDYETIFV